MIFNMLAILTGQKGKFNEQDLFWELQKLKNAKQTFSFVQRILRLTMDF